MTLAPIRGAPPGAPNPDFPIEKPKAESPQRNAAPTSADTPPIAPKRQRGSPIEVGSNDYILRFRIIPELPAIRRASMTVHVIAIGSSASHPFGFLQMSAQSARELLTAIRNGHSPIIAVGDEDGTVQIKFEASGSEAVFSVYKPGEQDALRQGEIDRGFDMKSMANELLADLGA